jgi:hypothetical protein
VLVRRTSGELVFEQDDTDFVFDQVMAEIFGTPRPKRPRVIRFEARKLPPGARA